MVFQYLVYVDMTINLKPVVVINVTIMPFIIVTIMALVPGVGGHY